MCVPRAWLRARKCGCDLVFVNESERDRERKR